MSHKISYSVDGKSLHVSYSFANHPVVHAEIKGNSSELACKYQLVIKELELTTSYLTHIAEIMVPYIANFNQRQPLQLLTMESKDQLVTQGLFSAATVSYGKIFMGVGRGRKQFQPKDFFTKDGEKFKKLHSWWMDVRNNYVAHSAGGPYDDARVVLLLSPPYIENNDWWWCFPHARFHRTPELRTINDLLAMTQFMLRLMVKKQEVLIKHIAEKLNSHDIESLRPSAVDSSVCNEIPSSPPIDE